MKRIVSFPLALFKQYQFVRFLFVGGINTLFGYGCFAFFIFIGIHYSIAVLLSTICGILFNFKTTGVIVFKNSDNKLIIRFVAVYGVAYLFNVAGLKRLIMFNVNTYIGGALLLLPVAVLTFILQKMFVYR